MLYNRPFIWALAGLCSLAASGQQAPQPELLYIGKLPLYFYHNTQGLKINDSLLMEILPGILGIKPGYIPFNLAARSMFVSPDKPIQSHPGELRIQLSTMNRIIKPWSLFCKHESTNDCESEGADFDWNIEPDSIYFVQIALVASDSPVFRLTVHGVNGLPSLLGWRTLNEYDQLTDNIHPVLLEKKNSEKVFNDPAPVIRTHSAKFIQFKFKPPVPWADSFLEYHWSGVTAELPETWKPSGGILTLPYHGIRRNGYLHIRYKGQINAAIYQVVVTPKWYQRPGFLLFAGILVLLLAGLVYYIVYTRKLRQVLQSETQLSQQLLAMQANITPHLVLNALASLLDLVESSKWSEVRIYVGKLVSLLQDAFAGRSQVYGSLEREMEKLRDFISIQQLRFGFEYHEIWPEYLRQAPVEVPSGLFQPLVENAIKYNFSGLHNENDLFIRIYAGGPDIFIRISGVCRKPGDAGTKTFRPSTGFGLTWVEKRISIHNKMNPAKRITLKLSLGTGQSDALFECQNHLKDFYV